MGKTWDQTPIEWVEPEQAAMEQAEMVWEEMERKKVEREEVEREEMERKKVEADGGLLILGIPVYVDDRRFRRLVHAVLDHIATRCPADLERIRCRVSCIETIRPDEMPPKVAASYCGPAQDASEYLVGGSDATAWPVKVSRRMIEGPRAGLVGILVHELGHAVSTQDDITVRSRLGEEWGDELAADHYAAKWGFGRLIASRRSDHCVAHHGPMPGEDVVVTFGEHRFAWHVTRDRVPVCDCLVR